MSDAAVVEAAVKWYMARTAFVKLPAGDPNARMLLNDLSEAEDRLSKTVRDGVRAAFSTS